MKDFKLQSLVWSSVKEQSGRLFGVSLRGFVFEVDLKQLRINNIRDTYGGTAWSLYPSPRAPQLAVGCEDGVIRLFRYELGAEENINAVLGTGSYLEDAPSSSGSNKGSTGVLEYHKSLPTSGSRILCLAYHPSEKTIFAGCSDGSVRCMDEDTGRVLFRMLGDVLRGSVSTLIWSLLVLPDSTVITGDSRGQVQVWDGAAGVLMDSFRQHTADVLTLAASPDGNAVFAAGVDGKVICLQKSNGAEAATLPAGGTPNRTRGRTNSLAGTAAENTWVYVHAHRAHSHDVLALAVCHSSSNAAQSVQQGAVADSAEKKRVSFAGLADRDSNESAGNLVLLSGGVDTRLCTYSVDHFVRSRPTWIPPIPTNALIQSSAKHEVITLRNREYLDIWGVNLLPRSSDTKENEDSAAGDENCRLKMRVQLKGNDHLHASAVSPQGDFVAVSSAAGIRFFEVKSASSMDAPVVLARATLPSVLADAEYAHAITFSETVVTNSDDVTATASKKRNNKAAAAKAVLHVAVHCAKRGQIVICQCIRGDGEASPELKVVQTINHRKIVLSRTGSMEKVSESALSLAVNKILFSANGEYLAVSSCSSKSIVYVFDLTRQKLHWILPPSTHTITDMVFRATATGLSLILLSAGNTFRIFDVVNMKLDAWSEANESNFPTYIRDLSAPLCGISLDPTSQNRVVLYGQGCCVHVDLSKPVTAAMKANVSFDASSKLLRASLLKKRANRSDPNATPSKKRSNLRTAEDANEDDLDELEGTNDAELSGGENDAESNFVVFNKYRNLLHVAYLADNQMVRVLFCCKCVYECVVYHVLHYNG